MLVFLCLPACADYFNNVEWMTTYSLRACTNLKDITIRGNRNSTPISNFHFRVFEGCSFRLQRFHCEENVLLLDPNLIGFFVDQTDIYDWTAQDTATMRAPFQTFPSHILPNLSTVTIRQFKGQSPAIMVLIGARPVKYVCLKITEDIPKGEIMTKAQHLRPASATLTHLSLIISGLPRGNEDGWIPIDIALSFANLFPNLKSFCLLSMVKHSESAILVSLFSSLKFLSF